MTETKDMFEQISAILTDKKDKPFSYEELAAMLKTDPDALKTFDEVYKTQVLESGELHENMLQWDTATVKAILDKKVYFPPELNSLIDRIVTELVLETRLYIYNAERGGYYVTYSANRDFMTEVTNEELKRYPEELRPQLTGKLMKIDISEPSYKELLQNYAGYKNAKNDSTKMFYYNMFRQGLDILDLDDFTYQMLEMNPNSMGFWFPPLVEGLYGSAFFKVPDTKILRVPITMLQLTRLGFETLNPVTKEIVNRYCQKVFHLDGYEDYFIKTGTYSSKYEFRNAHIHNPKEINEMGEYFLFLNHLTCSMASPLNNRCFYGANTTNEWVVREYIKDKENNPTIYNGLPLHTEYRVFVDFDTKEILGASPYWRSDVMKNEFKKVSSPQERHDYVVYKMHEDILNQRYHESVQTVLAELKKVIPRIELTGQWSIDVMRNGDDYYIIGYFVDTGQRMQDAQVGTGMFQHLVAQDVDILHPLVLHKVGEALALHTGHVEDVGISNDFFRKVRMFHVLDVVLAAVNFVFFGHPQLVGSDEVESGVEVAHGHQQGVDGAAIFEVTHKIDV